MQFPMSFWELGLWLAVVAIIFLATAEIVSSYYGEATIFIEKRRLETAALILGLLFIFIVALRVYEIIALP